MTAFKQTIFKRVHLSEKKKIFREIVSKRLGVVIKLNDDNMIQVKADNMLEDKILTCRGLAENSLGMGEIPVIVNFSIGYEKYYFHTKMTASPPIALIDVTTDLFLLQRRKQARMILPDNYDAFYSIINHRNEAVLYELRILDFSSGGCRLSYPSKEPFFNTDEVVSGVLRLGKRRPIDMGGLVRHTFTKPTDGILPQVFGLQFHPLTKTMESKLLTIFMDIQREISLST